MRLLVLSGRPVRSVLGYPECAAAMREALIARPRCEVFESLGLAVEDLAAAAVAYQAASERGSGSWVDFD